MGITGQRAAFEADYVNLNPVPTRGSVQVIFQILTEGYDHAYEVLGPPAPAHPSWFGISVIPSSESDRPGGAFKAAYMNFKHISSAKRNLQHVRLIFEVPLEEYDTVHRVLGMPNPAKEKRVVIAGLSPRESRPGIAPASAPSYPPSASHQYPRRNWLDMSPAERAGTCCRDVRFQYWLKEKKRIPLATEAEATAYVHRVIGGSRSNLGKPGYEKETEIWERIDHAFAKFLADQRHESQG